jgi:ribosomal protein S18 acetylase RimI-like enzyme
MKYLNYEKNSNYNLFFGDIMIFIQASIDDAEEISENNIAMAYESEKVVLSRPIALSAVQNLINDSSKGFYLLAKDNNKIIGQLMITFEWSDWRNSTIWWIQSVYVSPDFRKQGVFHALYQELKRIAKENEISILRLYVHNQNKNAILAYDSLNMEKKSYIIYEATID